MLISWVWDEEDLSRGVTSEAAGNSAEHKSVSKVEPIGLVDKLGVGERERERKRRVLETPCSGLHHHKDGARAMEMGETAGGQV